MGHIKDRFSSADLMDCFQVLRYGAYGRQVFALVELAIGAASMVDLKGLLRYLLRKGALEKKVTDSGAKYVVAARAFPRDIVRQKVRKSEEPWDGTWTVLTYDIPEHSSPARRKLRRILHRMGFGMLSASSWISPYDWKEALDRALMELGCEGNFSYIRSGEVTSVGPTSDPAPARLWPLEELRDGYERLAKRCAAAPVGPGANKRRARARLALWATKQVAALEERDPLLPPSLLPKAWPRQRALTALHSLRTRVQSDVGATEA